MVARTKVALARARGEQLSNVVDELVKIFQAATLSSVVVVVSSVTGIPSL